jgi:site-specific DNA-cytosine methylase
MGGECVYASEIDTAAAKIYAQNWGLTPAITTTRLLYCQYSSEIRETFGLGPQIKSLCVGKSI